MTKLAEAVDAINRYTGTDAETERILDLALPTMQYHASRFHYYHSRFDVDDLIANMQLYLFQWLRGKRHNGINQVWLSRLLYNQMITSVRCQFKDFRHLDRHIEYVNDYINSRCYEYISDDTMTDLRITIDELDVRDIVKDLLVKILIEQYSISDVLDYYHLSIGYTSQLYKEGMKALCSRFNIDKNRFMTPVRKGKISCKPAGYYKKKIEMQIIADYQAGTKLSTIIRKYGKSHSTIINILHRHGVPMRFRRKRNPADEKLIISDYQSGISYAEMCEKFKRSRAGIIKILARHGIERNRGSKKAA